MSDAPFRRVVIFCDPASDIRAAVEDAAGLASRWGAALHGIFLDDENLRRLAELPFGPQVSLSSPTFTEDLTAHHVASLAASLAAGMRRALAEVASQLGLEWTFSSVRDLPAAAASEPAEGDILLIEGAARAFSGEWRPRSALRQHASGFAGTVLIRGRRSGGEGILLCLPPDAEGSGPVLTAGAALASDKGAIVVMRSAAQDTDQEIAKYFAASQRPRLRILPVAEDGSVLRAIAQFDAALVVLNADGASPEVLSDLIAEGRRDILLIRA